MLPMNVGTRLAALVLMPCERVPKAAWLGNRCIFAGFIAEGGYAGDVIFAEAVQNADGTLGFVPFAR